MKYIALIDSFNVALCNVLLWMNFEDMNFNHLIHVVIVWLIFKNTFWHK